MTDRLQRMTGLRFTERAQAQDRLLEGADDRNRRERASRLGAFPLFASTVISRYSSYLSRSWNVTTTATKGCRSQLAARSDNGDPIMYLERQ